MVFKESGVLIGSKQSKAVGKGVSTNMSLNCGVDPGPYFLEHSRVKVGVECGVQKAPVERLAPGLEIEAIS